MAKDETEVIIRETAKSTAINWGTMAPFEIQGQVFIKRIGFADIPVVGIEIACKPEHVSSLVPVARQLVFRELEVNGLESEILNYTPTVGSWGGNRMFTDCNESSETKGKRKRGKVHHFHFEIHQAQVGHFNWVSHRRGEFPERKAS